MLDEQRRAIDALMRTFDARLAAAPLVDRRRRVNDRRHARRFDLVDSHRSAIPAAREYAFWANGTISDRRKKV